MTPLVPSPADILIVNGLSHIRRNITKALGDRGHAAVGVTSLAEMLERCREARPDLVILLDMFMPDWSMEPAEIETPTAPAKRRGCLSALRRAPRESPVPIAVYRPAGSEIESILAREIGPPMPRVLFLCPGTSEWFVRWDCAGADWADVLLYPSEMGDLAEVVERILNGEPHADPAPCGWFRGVTR